MSKQEYAFMLEISKYSSEQFETALSAAKKAGDLSRVAVLNELLRKF